MLVPYRFYQPYRLSDSSTKTFIVEGYLNQVVMDSKLRLTNRSGFAPIQVDISETENLGLSADPLLTGQVTVKRVSYTLNPGCVVWHTLSVPFIEPYSQTNSTIPSMFHTVSVRNLAASPTIDDVLGVSLYGVYEDAYGNQARYPTVL